MNHKRLGSRMQQGKHPSAMPGIQVLANPTESSLPGERSTRGPCWLCCPLGLPGKHMAVTWKPKLTTKGTDSWGHHSLYFSQLTGKPFLREDPSTVPAWLHRRYSSPFPFGIGSF